jgi:bacterioferritin
MHVGSDLPMMFASEHEAELDAIVRYNAGILACGDAKDFTTREILEDILEEEDDHVDSIEKVLDEINQMGLPLFLSTPVKK